MKSLFRILAVVMLTGVLYSFTGMSIKPAAADVINGFGCGISFPWAPGGAFTSDATHTVITSSQNTTLICHFNVTNPTGKAFTDKGFGCGTFLGGTTDSHKTISAGGQATLVCRLKL